MNRFNAKKRTKVTDVVAFVGSVTLLPVLVSRFKKARREGDRLELADATLSAAALALGAAKYLRRRPSEAKDPQR